ncbi:MAG TPA: adenine deaminase C-terminal domain-containing protein [Candidatus Binatia bacterium]|nr:adenine deaminase C-terminal domain-containing protein [Candidatus Binatia bacterium]
MNLSKEQTARLIRCAMGEIASELIVTGGKLINVYSGEILDGVEIAVLDGRVCYVGPSAAHTRGDRTEVLDARGLYIAPGFIDAHTHISHYCRPYEYLQAYLPHGTTAVVASADELATVFGYAGVRFFLDEVKAHPVRVYSLVSMVAPQDPLLCSTASLKQAEIAEALDDPRVLGLGEIVSWLRLVNSDDELLERIAMAHTRRKLIHGHTAGARDRRLSAVAATGVSSCHEPIHLEDALERLRLGYWTMLREGSLRQDLETTLKPLLRRQVNLQRLILVTDSMSPEDVDEWGHMDHVVRRAMSMGLSPLHAIQTVTLNPATYSGLESEIGGIAPGRFADMALIDDLESCRVEATLVGGEIVAKNGAPTLKSNPISLPPQMMHSLGLRPEISPQQLKILSPAKSANIRVIAFVSQTITGERIVHVNDTVGEVGAQPDQDLLKVAVFERHAGDGKIAFGFLKGFGARVGAVGTTTNLDENTLMVVGGNDEDMALCANTLIASGGGLAVVDQGEIVEKIEFPFGGIFSLDGWPKVAIGLKRIQRCLREKGSQFERPIYALSFLTFVTLPALRITARGLVNVKERKIVPLFAA